MGFLKLSFEFKYFELKKFKNIKLRKNIEKNNILIILIFKKELFFDDIFFTSEFSNINSTKSILINFCELMFSINYFILCIFLG